jgi:hypothetical protein
MTGRFNWFDCSVASTIILFALSKFNSFTSVRSEIIGVI